MLDFLIFALTATIGLLFILYYIYPKRNLKIDFPGPDPSDPKEGNLGDVVSSQGLANYIEDLHAKYGKIISFYWGEQPVVSVADAQLFVEHGQVFDKPEEIFSSFQPLLSINSLYLCNGTEGRRKHHITTENLSDSKLGDFYSRLNEEVATQIKETFNEIQSSKEVCLLTAVENWIFYPLMMSLYGPSVVLRHREAFKQLKKQFDYLWIEVSLAAQAERNISNKDVMERSEKHVRVLLSQLASATESIDEGHATVVSQLLAVSNKTSIVDDTLALLTVGYPTVTAAVVWFLYFVKRHPNTVETHLIKELQNSPSFCDNFQWLQQMKFLKACIDETLRLANVVPWTARVMDFPSMLENVKIPAKTPVLYALSVVHRSPEVFSDPDCFIPDRFITDKSQSHSPTNGRLSFLPFGLIGQRKCPGNRLSYTLCGLVCAHLFLHYHVNLQAEEYFQSDSNGAGGSGDRRKTKEGNDDVSDEEDGPAVCGLPRVGSKSGLVPLPDCTLLLNLKAV